MKNLCYLLLIIIRVLESFRKRFDAWKILFILEKWIPRNVSWLTELNSQRDASELVRNVCLQGKVCRVATGSNLSGFFSNCRFTSTLLELNGLAFERMLQEELSVKVVLKSSL